MADRLTDSVWATILTRIGKQKCTPFLGAGACIGRLPLAREVAQRWANEHGYPLPDSGDLARVAQFVAVKTDDVRPKEDIAELCTSVQPPDFTDLYEIHRVLADLPFKVYITTNYDDFMVAALKARNRDYRHELCRWNKYVLDNFHSVFDRESSYEPSVAIPLVFHLHGCREMPQSMVLTEDDYLGFLVRMAEDTALVRMAQDPVPAGTPGDIALLPAPIKQALAGSSLLFIGYGLNDWTFRVLFRALVGSLGASLQMQSVAVQLSPLPKDAPEDARQRAHDYLERSLSKIQKIPVSVYWGDVSEFATELRTRWEAFSHDHQTR